MTASFHIHGDKPYAVVAVHGGPGAQGSVCSLARMLAPVLGVLEPFQTRTTIQELVEELHETLEAHAESPAILVGHSWGAWLSVIFGVAYPDTVSKLVLVSSGPFTEEYARQIETNRFARF
jgi:pimeloyl-ACP methyl ester carboxylesterase